MVLIRAVSFRGRPVGGELVGQFAEAGGTIGRGENNTLVLPDPERFISRTHITISFQAGGFIMTDNSTKNPVILNGRPLPPAGQARLKDGDEITLGGYTLAVTLAPQISPAEVGVAWGSALPKEDPLAALGSSASKVPDPFADLFKPVEPAAPRMEPAIPWPEPPRPPVPGPVPGDPLADLRGREPSIDELLGLKPGSSDAYSQPAPLGHPFPQADPPAAVDPFVALGWAAKPVSPSPTVPDHGLEVFSPYAPPMARLDPALQPRPEVASPAAQPGASPPFAAPGAHPSREVTPGHAEEALLQALLRGAGIPDARLPKGLTPETMETIGKLVREAVQGTLDLLRARGLTKTEMRADVTVITPLDNNPLKFSPTVEAALVHMLAPQARGFLPPLRAMKEAYDDLRAHQFGVLAGMRAALEEVLARFAPGELENRLSDPTVLDNLMPMNRRAKLWDLFIERYGAVAADAREDFNAAFGKAFRRAYEAQVKQLREEGRRG